jgi:hypothetical protein
MEKQDIRESGNQGVDVRRTGYQKIDWILKIE